MDSAENEMKALFEADRARGERAERARREYIQEKARKKAVEHLIKDLECAKEYIQKNGFGYNQVECIEGLNRVINALK